MLLLHLYPTNLNLKSQEYKCIDVAILQAIYIYIYSSHLEEIGGTFNWCLDQYGGIYVHGGIDLN